MRLWVKDACDELVAGLRDLAGALLDRAERDGDVVLPGYTHGQRAQPVWLGQHLAAHVWALVRDIDRFHAVHRRADTCPSGAGALAGSSLPLDPAAVASELGFAAVHENPSSDATAAGRAAGSTRPEGQVSARRSRTAVDVAGERPTARCWPSQTGWARWPCV